MISRRAVLKSIAFSAGAAALTACNIDRRVRYVTTTPNPAATGTPAPAATITPTVTATPDFSQVLELVQPWFTIDEVVGAIPLASPVGGDTFDGGLVARVAGQERVVGLWRADQWTVNIPRLGDASQGRHTAGDMDTARKELASRGYGYDLILNTQGFFGRAGIIGTAASGGVIRSDCYGNLFEFTRPEGAVMEVRWRGEEWVGGYNDGSAWNPPLPLRFDGTEPFFTGYFMLTTDDCHDEQDTRVILDFAESNHVHMTFFPNTPYVKGFPDLWKEIAGLRHEIGFHTSRHSNGDWSPTYLQADCNDFENVVRDITGVQQYRAVTARPPFGLWYQNGWQDWVESRGLVTALWSRTIGWDSSPQVIRRTIKENGGLILLSHANPENVKWFNDNNDDLLKEMLANYQWPNLTEALYKNARPVTQIGLPV